jgi:uncharacterized protein YceK
MTRAAIVVLAVCVVVVSGCGTFADIMAGPIDDHLYYRGVRLDIAVIKEGSPLMALDLPFSAMADTLAVPTIAYREWTDPLGTPSQTAAQARDEDRSKPPTIKVIAPMERIANLFTSE